MSRTLLFAEGVGETLGPNKPSTVVTNDRAVDGRSVIHKMSR